MNEHPKILLYDIENAPELGYYWPPGYDTNIITIKEPWYMLSFAYTWYDPDGLNPDDIKFERKAARRGDDKQLMKKLRALYDEADAVMAHNNDRFDEKKSWTRIIAHDLGPTSPYISLDTLKMVRQKFAFSSNKLDELAKFFDIGEKLPHSGMATWYGCMDNDPVQWDKMEQYNKHDVVLLDGLYRKIAPYVRTRLNRQPWSGLHACTSCGSRNVQSRGQTARGGTDKTHQMWHCQDCRNWDYELLSNVGRFRPA